MGERQFKYRIYMKKPGKIADSTIYDSKEVTVTANRYGDAWNQIVDHIAEAENYNWTVTSVKYLEGE